MMKKKLFALIILAFSFLIAPSVIAEPGNQTNITAQGGNTTIITLDLSQESNIWQGFYGHVTGGILLSNADQESFYDWGVVDASGEVLATRQIISDWSNINCTNQIEIYLEEERLNIANKSSEGINDTYKNTTHPTIDISGRLISGCRSTLTHNSTGDKQVFWNVLLNSGPDNTVYTAIIDNDREGFNGTQIDFQLLVPTNTTTGQNTYYIYTEIE